jgi:ABC-type amino acid transport substrate-binding protein
MTWQEHTVSDVADEIAACLAKGDSNSATRLAFHFLERYDKSDWETRQRITIEPPVTTGDDRYDALLAGIVEFACASHGTVAPDWVDAEHYFLKKWWFVSGMSKLHADALVHSPISLARREVFVTQGALEYA